MVTDDQHRNPFGKPLGEVPDLPRLDAGVVIRRSQTRRLIRQVAVGGVSALALLGFVGGIGLGIRTLGFGVTAADSSAGSLSGGASPEYSGGGASKSIFGDDGTAAEPSFDCGSAMPTASSALRSAGVTVDLRITPSPGPASAAAGRLTLRSATDVPAQLRSGHPIIVVGHGGTVTSVFSVDSRPTPAPLDLDAGNTRVIAGRLSAPICGEPAAKFPSTTKDIVIVIPVLIDGSNRWLTTVPEKVTIR